MESAATDPKAACNSRSLIRNIVCLMLCVLTLAVFFRLGSFDFVPIDDGNYVYENPRVFNGLNGENARWALTTGYFSNWHPLTWWSYMFDCQLLGPRPGPIHLVSVFLHLANTLLLLLVLNRLTGR